MKPGVKVQLMVPSLISIVSELRPAEFGNLPKQADIIGMSVDFTGWINTRESITATAWLDEKETQEIQRVLKKALEKRRGRLASGSTDEVGIFDIEYHLSI